MPDPTGRLIAQLIPACYTIATVEGEPEGIAPWAYRSYKGEETATGRADSPSGRSPAIVPDWGPAHHTFRRPPQLEKKNKALDDTLASDT